MARLEKNNYKSIQKNELNDPVVFVVDMIKGFVNIGPFMMKSLAMWKRILKIY